MAVDTRNKRFSMLGLNGSCRVVLPNPDGDLDSSADRQQLVYLYSGIEADEPASGRRGVRVRARGRFVRTISRTYPELSRITTTAANPRDVVTESAKPFGSE